MVYIDSFVEIFKDKIQGEGENSILLLPYGAIVSVVDFANLFRDVENLTYDELVAFDGGIIGYIPFFDECKAGGIL